jgi:hypothetical protein
LAMGEHCILWQGSSAPWRCGPSYQHRHLGSLLNPAIEFLQNISHCYWYNFVCSSSLWRTNTFTR